MEVGIVLERAAGPSGWVEIDGQRHEVDGWELFEGDENSPHMCRGWFRLEDSDFSGKVGTTVHLELLDEDGINRPLTAQLRKARTTVPEWEFVAEP